MNNYIEGWSKWTKDYNKCQCMNVPIYTCDMCKKEFDKYELSKDTELFADTVPKLINGLCRECEEKVNGEISKWLREHYDELMENVKGDLI